MKAYWDASALVETLVDNHLHERLKREGAISRTHSLSEVFSTITGGRFAPRADAGDAAKSIDEMVQHLEFVDLTAKEVMEALKKARALGVRGGRVHDFLHAVAAAKSGAKVLLTLDRNDFVSLGGKLQIEQV